MEKSNVEMLRLILEISVAIVVVFLVVKFIFKKCRDKFIAQKNKQTKKSCLNFLNETSQNNWFDNLYPLEKVPIDDLQNSEKELTEFYLKKFYNQRSISANHLGEYLFFVESAVKNETKEIILKILKEATLQADPKILATIVVRAIEMKVVKESSYNCYLTLTKDFIVKTIESKHEKVTLFLEEFEISTADLLSANVLNRKEQAIVAIQCLILTSRYKSKRRAE